MSDICEFHKDMEKLISNGKNIAHTESELKVNKSTIKWIAGMFALPLVLAILVTYAFVTSADYRYGSSMQAQSNAASIKLLEERTLNMKADMINIQAQISADLFSIKNELKDITKELLRKPNK